MNNQNLRPIGTLATSKQREIQSKGGKARAEKARRRKALKEELILLLSEGKTQEKLCLALIEKAQNGDVRAFESIRDTIGEKPTDKMDHYIETPIIIDDISC